MSEDPILLDVTATVYGLWVRTQPAMRFLDRSMPAFCMSLAADKTSPSEITGFPPDTCPNGLLTSVFKSDLLALSVTIHTAACFTAKD